MGTACISREALPPLLFTGFPKALPVLKRGILLAGTRKSS
jgi:hypothetical protein